MTLVSPFLSPWEGGGKNDAIVFRSMGGGMESVMGVLSWKRSRVTVRCGRLLFRVYGLYCPGGCANSGSLLPSGVTQIRCFFLPLDSSRSTLLTQTHRYESFRPSLRWVSFARGRLSLAGMVGSTERIVLRAKDGDGVPHAPDESTTPIEDCQHRHDR